MYVQERLENWKNYVPAARAQANVIKWYTESRCNSGPGLQANIVDFTLSQ